MWPFGDKKSTAPKTETTERIFTIPMEFYGGANPVIKFKKVEKQVEVNAVGQVLTTEEKRLLEKSTAAGAGAKWHPANLLANKKFLVIGGLAVFAVFIVIAGGYYWWQASKGRKTSLPPPPVISQPVVVPEVVVETPTTTEEAAETATTTAPSLGEALLEFPSMLLGDSADLDKDGITDAAEEVFGTDPGVADSDNDQYADEHEIFNLYNPAGFTPINLIDSGLVKEFANPVFGYKLYYPVNWAVGNVDPDYRQMLFSTLTGENVEIRVFDLPLGESFTDWFAARAAGERLGDLQEFTTRLRQDYGGQARGGLSGQKRSDGLVYYFTDQNHVYAILYHTTDSNVVNYRVVLKMMARSFQLGETAATPTSIEEPETLNNTPLPPLPEGNDQVPPLRRAGEVLEENGQVSGESGATSTTGAPGL